MVPDGVGGGRTRLVEVGGGILGKAAIGVSPEEKLDRVWFHGANVVDAE